MPPVKRPRLGTGYIKTGPDSPGDMSLEEKINAAPVGQVVEFNLRVREDSDDAGSQQDQPDEGKSKAWPRKRPRWKTGVLKTCNRCADFEAFISLLMPLLTKPLRRDPGVRALNCDRGGRLEISRHAGSFEQCLLMFDILKLCCQSI